MVRAVARGAVTPAETTAHADDRRRFSIEADGFRRASAGLAQSNAAGRRRGRSRHRPPTRSRGRARSTRGRCSPPRAPRPSRTPSGGSSRASASAPARCERSGSARLTAGPLELDLTTRRVTAHDVEIDLTPTEFSLLEMLMRHAGQVVTRRMLCEHLWDSDWEGTTNVIEVHINRLRNKLQRCVADTLIQTVRGRGYALRAN